MAGPTRGQKLRLATAGVFDWGSYPFNGILAELNKRRMNQNPGDRDGTPTQNAMAHPCRQQHKHGDDDGDFATLLHEDPRYYQLGRGRFEHRAYHAINRLFVTRTDSGHGCFNFSETMGNATAAALSNIYHAPEDRMASRNASAFALLFLYDGMNNELKEFWPDIRRKMFIRTRRSFTLSYCSMDSCAVAHLWVIWTQRKKIAPQPEGVCVEYQLRVEKLVFAAKTCCSSLETDRNHNENGTKNCIPRLQHDFYRADSVAHSDSRPADTGNEFQNDGKASVTGRITTVSGDGATNVLPGTTVKLIGPPVGLAPQSTVTDAEGRYEFTHVAAGA